MQEAFQNTSTKVNTFVTITGTVTDIEFIHIFIFPSTQITLNDTKVIVLSGTRSGLELDQEYVLTYKELQSGSLLFVSIKKKDRS